MILCCLLLVMSAAAFGKSQNALGNHPSSYIAMHAADRVAWRLWGQEAIDEARREGKLLFVSSGNFSCYWCHVMQRDNFLNSRIAALINRNFIPVLIDSELQPALDAQLTQFLNRTLGYAGWPLQVFITPDGYPLAGTTYAPPEEFEPMLQELANEWNKDSKSLAARAQQAALGHRRTLPPVSDTLEQWAGNAATDELIRQALAVSDPEAGGFGKQSKFPSTPQLQALLFAYRQRAEMPLQRFLILTLDRMVNGGLHDPLGGGFFRYTTDREWREPHFEKMLYDNAQLALLYLQAAQILDRPDYLQIGQETLDFILRELSSPEGGMMSSLAAVGKSMHEGEYYLWNRDELETLLTPAEFRLLGQAWDMQRNAPREEKYLPRRIRSAQQIAILRGDDIGTVEKSLQQLQKKLLRARSTRTLPRDRKQLASWNGLALTALAQGAQLPHGENYRRAGQRLRDYLVKILWDGKQLHRVRAQHGQRTEGTLEDYALAAKGLLAWSQVSRNAADGRLAGQIIDGAWRRFYNEKTGWQLEQRSLLPVESAIAALPDGALPSASATLLSASLEWASTTRDSELRKRALVALNAGRLQFNDSPFGYASYAAAFVRAQN
ncbi:hypothetical protein GALLN_00462 [Gallionellaceae bacterium]|nr:hypothetical protein GALLN_00462 [Gallionellaceae bacterium]